MIKTCFRYSPEHLQLRNFLKLLAIMADGEPVASKPFGMDNLFFGNPDNIEIPRLPSAVQPARQLAFRTRRETSHDDNDDDDDWQPDEDSDDDGEASAPVQTVSSLDAYAYIATSTIHAATYADLRSHRRLAYILVPGVHQPRVLK